MASLMSTLATLAPSGVRLSILATGRQTLSATLVELPLNQWRQQQDQWQQHRDQWGQQGVQQQRHRVQEVLQALQPVALVHCAEARPQSL